MEQQMTPADPNTASPLVIAAMAALTWLGGIWGWLGANHSSVATACCLITTGVCVATYVRNGKKNKP